MNAATNNEPRHMHAAAIERAIKAIEQSNLARSGREFSLAVEPILAALIAEVTALDASAGRGYVDHPFVLCTTCPQCAALFPTVRNFTGTMVEKLHANHHKGDRTAWLEADPLQLCDRVGEEAAELRAAVETSSHAGRAAEILAEAADVANMSMMVADACGGLPGGKAITTENEWHVGDRVEWHLRHLPHRRTPLIETVTAVFSNTVTLRNDSWFEETHTIDHLGKAIACGYVTRLPRELTPIDTEIRVSDSFVNTDDVRITIHSVDGGRVKYMRTDRSGHNIPYSEPLAAMRAWICHGTWKRVEKAAPPATQPSIEVSATAPSEWRVGDKLQWNATGCIGTVAEVNGNDVKVCYVDGSKFCYTAGVLHKAVSVGNVRRLPREPETVDIRKCDTSLPCEPQQNEWRIGDKLHWGFLGKTDTVTEINGNHVDLRGEGGIEYGYSVGMLNEAVALGTATRLPCDPALEWRVGDRYQWSSQWQPPSNGDSVRVITKVAGEYVYSKDGGEMEIEHLNAAVARGEINRLSREPAPADREIRAGDVFLDVAGTRVAITAIDSDRVYYTYSDPGGFSRTGDESLTRAREFLKRGAWMRVKKDASPATNSTAGVSITSQNEWQAGDKVQWNGTADRGLRGTVERAEIDSHGGGFGVWIRWASGPAVVHFGDEKLAEGIASGEIIRLPREHAPSPANAPEIDVNINVGDQFECAGMRFRITATSDGIVTRSFSSGAVKPVPLAEAQASIRRGTWKRVPSTVAAPAVDTNPPSAIDARMIDLTRVAGMLTARISAHGDMIEALTTRVSTLEGAKRKPAPRKRTHR